MENDIGLVIVIGMLAIPAVGFVMLVFEIIRRQSVAAEERLTVGVSIGDSLVDAGDMTREQVDEVLRRQKFGDNRPFGWIAVRAGFIEYDTLKKHLSGS